MNSLLHLAILAQTAPPDVGQHASCLTGSVVVPFQAVGVIVGCIVAGTLAYFLRRMA